MRAIALCEGNAEGMVSGLLKALHETALTMTSVYIVVKNAKM